MSNEIPHAMQLVIDERDAGHCMRCGGRGSNRHHRRRRRESDAHTHEPCNVVTLCNVCHAWAHAHPREAWAMGWIVKPWESPLDRPVLHFNLQWVRLECDGTYTLMGECANCEEIRVLEAGLCLTCLRDEVCHLDEPSAAAAMCGCRGRAGKALRDLLERERIEA